MYPNGFLTSSWDQATNPEFAITKFSFSIYLHFWYVNNNTSHSWTNSEFLASGFVVPSHELVIWDSQDDSEVMRIILEDFRMPISRKMLLTATIEGSPKMLKYLLRIKKESICGK